MGPEPAPDLELQTKLQSLCSSIQIADYKKTSEATTAYNCVAWALRDAERWWEPTPSGQYHWPSTKNQDYSLLAYTQMFKEQGFVTCEQGDPEDGFEKIALYSDEAGEFRHVALQLPSGLWSSKLGDWEDIEHRSLEALQGSGYGSPCLFMKRPRVGGPQ